MNITSLTFLLFLLAVLIVYYIVPTKMQWCVLLCSSLLFYLAGGMLGIVYIGITSLSIYTAACRIQALTEQQHQFFSNHKELTREQKKDCKARTKTARKRILVAALVLNFGLLCTLKYFHFAFAQINALLSVFGVGPIQDTFSFFIPLGISFYTFQATGYLVDVYWEKCAAEKNYFKVLLFISFFPQITQGPISNYQQLSQELFCEHRLTYKNYTYGMQRLVWGFAKKMLLANVLAGYVQDVFTNYESYAGITVFIGALMYSVQIYADFSGYMDIMCGLCEVMGIHLTENFLRPYFSKSVAEYWRRWHISLGVWFKTYIYYPIGMSHWNRRLAAFAKKKWGKSLGDMVPASVALVIVWTATGLWHGASWAYITWGLVNGLFIILSMWTEPFYERWKKNLRIRENSFLWRAFQTIRTFLLVTFIKVLPEVGTLFQGMGLIWRIFADHTIPGSFHTLLPFVQMDATRLIHFALAAAMTVLLFLSSLLQRKRLLRDGFNRLPTPVRCLILSITTILILIFGVEASWGEEGFMYANF